MATIITLGRKPEPPVSWYLKQPVTCPQCGCVFQLDKKDFAEQGAHQFNTHVDWKVVATARTPNGEQIIEGKCPDCHETVRITGRMGGLSATGGSVTIGGTTYNKRDVATGGIVGGADAAPVGERELHVTMRTDQRDIEEITRAVAARIRAHCRERSRAVGIS